MPKKIRVFSSPTCPYCIALKEFLKDKGFTFEDIDVTEDVEAQKELKEETKQMGVPVICIDNEFIVGFDRKRIIELLEIKD